MSPGRKSTSRSSSQRWPTPPDPNGRGRAYHAVVVGPPALSLANTWALKRGRLRDLLTGKDDLERWLAREQLPDRGELAEFRALRETITAAFASVSRGEQPPPATIVQINRASRREPVAPQLDWAGGKPQVELAGADPLAAVARSAITLLAGPDRHRLRECEAPDCPLFFLTGNPRRRWCSTACGTRVRVTRHLARGKAPAR